MKLDFNDIDKDKSLYEEEYVMLGVGQILIKEGVTELILPEAMYYDMFEDYEEVEYCIFRSKLIPNIELKNSSRIEMIVEI